MCQCSRAVSGGTKPVPFFKGFCHWRSSRPADFREALQAACLAEEFSHALSNGLIPRKIRETLKRLLRIAV